MTLKLRCSRRICQVVCASLNVMRPMFLSDIQRREGCCDDTFSVSWQMPAKCVKCLNEHPSVKPLFWGFLCAQDGEVIHSLASRLLPLKIKLFFKFCEMGCLVFFDWCTLCIPSAHSKHFLHCILQSFMLLGHLPSPCHMHLVTSHECMCYTPYFSCVGPSVGT